MELANLDLANIIYVLFINYRCPSPVEITVTVCNLFLKIRM